MLTAEQVRLLGVRTMRRQTERDRQVKVGASNLSNPCDYHLAMDLRGESTKPDYMEFGEDERAWLGGKNGTGIHAVFSWAVEELQKDTPPSERDLLSEYKLKIGHINGYGDVNSTLDLATISMGHLIDLKTTLRKKTAQYWAALGRKSKVTSIPVIESARSKLAQYQVQTHFYSKGLIDQGIAIDGNSLLFINRDGTGWFDSEEHEEDFKNPDNNRDIWEWTYDYDQGLVDAAWARVNRIYEDVANGRRDFERHEHCYPCQKSGADLTKKPGDIVTVLTWEEV